MNHIRVLLADDHTLLLDAIEKLLPEDCKVVGKVTDGRSLLRVAREVKPQVIVVDISMPILNGLDAGIELRRTMPEIKLIYLTMNIDPAMAAEACRIGAAGFLLKSSAGSELALAIHEAIAGRTYITPHIAGDLMRAMSLGGRRSSVSMLTSRQRQVVQLLAEGRSMKEAASILHVTPRTIAHHKYKTMHTLGIETSAELVQFAVKQNIV